MSPLWRPKRTRRLAPAIVTGQLQMKGDAIAQLSATAVPSGSHVLKVGMFNQQGLGQGPGRNLGGNIFRFALMAPGDVNTNAKLNTQIALADQYDILLTFNPSLSRGVWAPGGIFSRALYENQVRLYQGNAILTDAVNRGRVWMYLVDEPQLAFFNGSISPADVNWMGLLHKSIWPGCYTHVRAGAVMMSGTSSQWDDSNGVAFLRPPVGGWTGVDYAWSAWAGQHIPSAGETFTQFFAREKTQLDQVGLGSIPSVNWWSGGIYNDTDGVPACWDYGNVGGVNPPTGYVVGTQNIVNPQGTQIPCGTRPAAETRFIQSPALLRRWADVVSQDPDAPFTAAWTFPYDQWTDLSDFGFYYDRPDFTAAWDYVIQKCAQRPAHNALRPVK